MLVNPWLLYEAYGLLDTFDGDADIEWTFHLNMMGDDIELMSIPI